MRSVNCPMVSIIMPVYNAEEFLKDSVGDILAQSFDDFELICVDDGSTDNSGAILDKYAENDPRIRVIHKENGGGGTARNRGMDDAIGKYLVFLDSDDKFEKDLLELAVGKAEETDAEVVTFAADTFDHVTGEHKPAPWLLKGNDRPETNDPFRVINTSVWNKIFRRVHIVENGIRFQTNRIVDTMSFTFLAVVYAQRLEIISKVLLHYRTNNSGSIISNSDKYPTEAFDACVAIKEKLIEDGRFDEKKSIFSGYARNYIRDRLIMLKTCEGYSALYETVHRNGLEDLGLSEDSDGVDPSVQSFFDEIVEKDTTSFLFDNRKKMSSNGLTGAVSWLLTNDVINDKHNIAIYGGGDVGKDFFMQVLRRPELKAVCWVDRNYEKLGYPLQPPYVLKETVFDIVLIAVADKRAADVIKRTLIEMNIPEEKIVWDEYTQII